MVATLTGCPAKIRGISLLTRPVQTHHSLKKLRIIHITGRQKAHPNLSSFMCSSILAPQTEKEMKKAVSCDYLITVKTYKNS